MLEEAKLRRLIEAAIRASGFSSSTTLRASRFREPEPGCPLHVFHGDHCEVQRAVARTPGPQTSSQVLNGSLEDSDSSIAQEFGRVGRYRSAEVPSVIVMVMLFDPR